MNELIFIIMSYICGFQVESCSISRFVYESLSLYECKLRQIFHMHLLIHKFLNSTSHIKIWKAQTLAEILISFLGLSTDTSIYFGMLLDNTLQMFFVKYEIYKVFNSVPIHNCCPLLNKLLTLFTLDKIFVQIFVIEFEFPRTKC